MKKINSKHLSIIILFFVLVLVIFNSISNKTELVKCEGFNLNKIPYDSSYFKQDIKYTNGLDTIELHCTNFSFTKFYEYYRGGGSFGQCYPELFIQYFDSTKTTDISLGFSYNNSKNSILMFDLGVNSSIIGINLDTLNFNKLTIFSLNENNNLSATLTKKEMIKRIDLYKLKVVYFEKFSGENWKLINDSTSK